MGLTTHMIQRYNSLKLNYRRNSLPRAPVFLPCSTRKTNDAILEKKATNLKGDSQSPYSCCTLSTQLKLKQHLLGVEIKITNHLNSPSNQISNWTTKVSTSSVIEEKYHTNLVGLHSTLYPAAKETTSTCKASKESQLKQN